MKRAAKDNNGVMTNVPTVGKNDSIVVILAAAAAQQKAYKTHYIRT